MESPTHTCGNILDLVLTNSPEHVLHLSVHSPEYQCITSDHYLITFSINFKFSTHSTSTKEFFNFSKGDYNGLTEYLSNCDLSIIYYSSDVEEIWYILRSNILAGIELFIPKVKLHCRQFPNWFTPQLRHSHKCLHTLQRKYNRNPTPNNFQRLTKAQVSFQASSIAAKSAFEQTLIYNFTTNKDTKIFRYIKEFSKSHNLPPELHNDSITANTDLDKAELFNQYFHSIFSQSNFNLPDTSNLPVPGKCLGSIHFTVQEVLEALNNLDPNKASGIDNIPPTVLKHCAFALAIPIHHLFMTSITSGTIPSEWKLHKITAVPKSGDKTSVKNYRPISLLCITSKVLERLIYDKIINSVSNCITQYQFGFQKNSSTLHQLLIYFNQLITSKDEIDTIYIDFRKAFDSVPHNELLVKLWNMGITGTLWNWFSFYLHNRTQCVSVGNHLSVTLLVISGVPQGSILDPLLFLIFINDLPSIVTSDLFEFADDTKLFRQITSTLDIEHLQEDINSLFNWSINNFLSFNLSKFVFMSYHRKFNSTYHVNGHLIDESSSCKDLGIIFTNSLTWQAHYEMMPINLLAYCVGSSRTPIVPRPENLCISL